MTVVKKIVVKTTVVQMTVAQMTIVQTTVVQTTIVQTTVVKRVFKDLKNQIGSVLFSNCLNTKVICSGHIRTFRTSEVKKQVPCLITQYTIMLETFML